MTPGRPTRLPDIAENRSGTVLAGWLAAREPHQSAVACKGDLLCAQFGAEGVFSGVRPAHHVVSIAVTVPQMPGVLSTAADLHRRMTDHLTSRSPTNAVTAPARRTRQYPRGKRIGQVIEVLVSSKSYGRDLCAEDKNWGPLAMTLLLCGAGESVQKPGCGGCSAPWIVALEHVGRVVCSGGPGSSTGRCCFGSLSSLLRAV
jgi:hypothetical protein